MNDRSNHTLKMSVVLEFDKSFVEANISPYDIGELDKFAPIPGVVKFECNDGKETKTYTIDFDETNYPLCFNRDLCDKYEFKNPNNKQLEIICTTESVNEYLKNIDFVKKSDYFTGGDFKIVNIPEFFIYMGESEIASRLKVVGIKELSIYFDSFNEIYKVSKDVLKKANIVCEVDNRDAFDWTIPVEWTVIDKIKVKAKTLKEAVEWVKSNQHTIPLGTNPTYLEDSWQISYDTDDTNIEELVKEIESDQEIKNVIESMFKEALRNDEDELDFYSRLFENFSLASIKKYAPQYYDIAKIFGEEHGLI